MKKAVIAIVCMVLLVALGATAASYWGYSRYGGVYAKPDFYSREYHYPYYEEAYYPYSTRGYTYYPYSYFRYNYYPSYARPYYYYPYSPLAPEVMYRYGMPSVSAQEDLDRGRLGDLCGVVQGQQFGCQHGLVCDYTKVAESGIGTCSNQDPRMYN